MRGSSSRCAHTRRSAASASSCDVAGMLRISKSNSQSRGTTLTAMPPWITPVCSVECGTAKRASRGSSRPDAVGHAADVGDQLRRVLDRVHRRRRQRRMRFAAAHPATEIALALVRDDRLHVGGLADDAAGGADAAVGQIGHQATHAEEASSPRRRSAPGAPASSACAARKRGAHASAIAMKPFMSAVPRPWMRPSRVANARLNGSLAQSCPSTGTVSV